VKWRFIPFKRYDPYIKIALNGVSINSVKSSGIGIIWLAGWKQSCINIGFGQKINDVLDLKEAKKRKLLIVRRQGGGGPMYLDEKGEITWNIIAPGKYFSNNVNGIYKQVSKRLIAALGEIGISAKYKPINDIVTKKGKISGMTMKKAEEIVYVAGTLLYSVDKSVLDKLLRPEKDIGKRKSLPEKEKKVSCVGKECNASLNETLEVLAKHLLMGINYEKTNWSKEELLNAEKLAKKYRDVKWIYQK
jgi:lipoate---protein ligase